MRLRPTLRRLHLFPWRERPMIAFLVTSASLRLPPQGAGRNPCMWQGGVLKITLLNDTQP